MSLARRGLWGILLILLMGIALPGEAEERIRRYDSTVRVNPDAVVSVREEITVTVEGVAIRHGIFRDFPTVYRTADGKSRRVGFEVRGVWLDGAVEPYATEALSGQGVRVRIGDADRLVPPGEHTYALEYDTWRQVGFFGDFDEIYWNVTGNGWTFPMDEVRATVLLPPGAPVLRTAFYTGPLGSQGKNAQSSTEEGRVIFSTTAPLGVREGLTVAVAFPKGWVTSGDRVLAMVQNDALRDELNRPEISLGAMLLVALYFALVWWKFGRDIPRGIVIPLFDPPDGIDPPLASFVHRQGDLVPEVLPAAVIDMAVKGHLRIVEEGPELEGMAGRLMSMLGGRRYVLVRSSPTSPRRPLADIEYTLLESIFSGRKEVPLDTRDREERKRLSEVIEAFRRDLRTSGKAFVVGNLGWSIGGMILTLALFATLGILMNPEDDVAPVVIIMLAFGSLGGGFLAATARRMWRERPGQGCRGVFRRATGWIAAAVLALVTVGIVVGLGLLLSPAFALGFGGALASNMTFFFLMRNYTKEGRRVADQVAGFRMYLRTAERDRIRILAKLDPPEDTPERFERMLPYALALGVEREWAARFADVLEQASYAPEWYTGSTFAYGSAFADHLSSFGTSFGSTLTEATSPPGSSSGSDGGGSSGGGGGGGGGGGW